MQISRDSLLVRWAYFDEIEWRVPGSTSLCALFWRVVLLSPLKCLLIAALSPLFLWFLIDDKRRQVKFERLVARSRNGEPPPKRISERIADSAPAAVVKAVASVVSEIVLAVKQRACPLIQIVREK